jgi:hypothetical protein
MVIVLLLLGFLAAISIRKKERREKNGEMCFFVNAWYPILYSFLGGGFVVVLAFNIKFYDINFLLFLSCFFFVTVVTIFLTKFISLKISEDMIVIFGWIRFIKIKRKDILAIESCPRNFYIIKYQTKTKKIATAHISSSLKNSMKAVWLLRSIIAENRNSFRQKQDS